MPAEHSGSTRPDAAHLKDVTTLDLADLDPDWITPPSRPEPDNADPHPVILRMDPRFVEDDGITHEAYLWVEVEHPDSCPETVEVCPVQDYLDNIGADEHFMAAFPEPDYLSDDDLAALDGTVRFVVITRRGWSHSGPYGTEYESEHTFTWTDE